MSFTSKVGVYRIFLTVLVLAGLGLAPSVYAFGLGKSKSPDWAVNQASDTAAVLYGIGSGSSPDLAKQSALQDIAGKLLTKVESETSSHTSSSGGRVSERFTRNITTSVDDMGLGGYLVDKSEKKGKVYWVRLSLEKTKLYESTKAQVDPLLLELKNFFSTLSGTSALEVKQNHKSVEKTLEEARGKLFVMKAVRSNFDLLGAQQKLSGYENALKTKVDSLKIYVKASGSLKELASKLTNALNQEGMITTTEPSGSGVVTINLKGTFTDSIQVGAKFSAATVSARTVDELGKLVSERRYQIHGSSHSSHTMARQIAINKFIDDLMLEGVSERLGFE